MTSGSEEKSELHQLIENRKVSFFKKLKAACARELVYWEDRRNPPNDNISVFRRFVDMLPEDSDFRPGTMLRESQNGKYGATGQKSVFYFEYEFTVMGKTRKIYCKGFFFEAHDLRGVEIQSFKGSTKPPIRLV